MFSTVVTVVAEAEALASVFRRPRDFLRPEPVAVEAADDTVSLVDFAVEGVAVGVDDEEASSVASLTPALNE